MLAFLSLLLVLPCLVSAFPTEKRQSVSVLSAAQISAFKPYTFFAKAAGCSPTATLTWTCGEACAANSDFQTTASGGDGGDVQFWYVGYSPSLNSVVVGHQGTDPSNIESILVDAAFALTRLDSANFPGVPSSVLVHDGFKDSQARSAPQVLSAVNRTLTAHPGATVVTTGHSLGAALAVLDAVFLRLQLPANVPIKTIGYGLPRVGNPAFATYFDSIITDFRRVNNKKDPVPIIPGRFLGYDHPNGEVHIDDDNSWNLCPGHENTDSRCTMGDVPNILVSNADDHNGPYDGVEMGCD